MAELTTTRAHQDVLPLDFDESDTTAVDATHIVVTDSSAHAGDDEAAHDTAARFDYSSVQFADAQAEIAASARIAAAASHFPEEAPPVTTATPRPGAVRPKPPAGRGGHGDGRIGILHVVDCLNVGGTERQLFELLRRTDRTRFRPIVACFKQGGELYPRLVEIGLTPIVFPLRGSLAQANTAYQIARMALLCRRENVGVIHAHDFYSNLIGVAAAGLAGARSIASRRDLAHWLTGGQRKALQVACRLADVVIANAAAVADQTERELGVSRSALQVVPNGIDVAHFDLQAFKTPDPLLPPAPASRPRITMVGSMHLPDKGHGDLLQAAALLKSQGVHAQWLLVSDGVLRKPLEEQAQALGLGDDVQFLGRRHDIPAVLVRSDLIVHPSWAEGFPNAVLEGMCAARPVVATRVGGIPEVMRDGVDGIIVEPKQPVALAAAIAKVLEKPLAGHVMGLRGRERVEATYSLDRLCRTTEALYTSLVGDDLGTGTYATAVHG